jgi:hypothetical protein
MTELSPTAKALVDAARDEVGLPPDQRARVRARVLTTAGAGGASIFGSLFAKAAAAKLLGSPIVAWTALAVTVTGAGAAYTLTHGSSHHPAMVAEERATTAAPSPEVQRAPIAPAPPATAETVTRETPPVTAPGEEAQPRRARPVEAKAHGLPASGTTAVARSSSAPTENADTGFAEDARLLRDVRAALSSGQGERALTMLTAREANPTSGVFAEERAAAKIVTLCALGRPEARAAAARFLSAHGTSPLAERVRRACPR